MERGNTVMTSTAGTTIPVFPQDWNDATDGGHTFLFDPMHNPFPVTPLGGSFFSPLTSAGMVTAARELQIPMRGREVRFRNYYQFGRTDLEVPADEQAARAMSEAIDAAFRPVMERMLERWHGDQLPDILQHLRGLQKLTVEVSSGGDLGGAIREAKERVGKVWITHFRIATPMLLSMQLFDELHADLFGGTDADAHALLVGGLSESIKAGIGLTDLAARVRELGLADLFATTEPAALAGKLGATDAGRKSLAELRSYLDTYGMRQDLYSLTTPTWQEDPSIPLATIRMYLQSGHDTRREHDALAASAEKALEERRARLASYPSAVREEFETMVRIARGAAFLQEEHNFYIDQQVAATMRYLFLAIGRQLVEAQVLIDADDVFMLYLEELEQIVADAGRVVADDGIQERVRRRWGEIADAGQMFPPPYIGAAPSGPPDQQSPLERGLLRFFGGPPREAEHDNQIQGTAGSQGSVTGKALVARNLKEAMAVKPGEILVAITTMPAWTPLFGIAAAIVTETGGPLSHCAIVAREYGIPAVVGAHGATRRIRSGQAITVDGGTGLVTIDG
jgi:pyruvate,water dikinase